MSRARFRVELPGAVVATLSRLSDGEGYSVPGQSSEFAIWSTETPGLSLPSEVDPALARFDALFEKECSSPVAPYVPTKDAVEFEQAFLALEAPFPVGTKVEVRGTGQTGEVVRWERSTHPAFSDSVTVRLDGGATMLVMGEDRNVVDFYAAALEAL